MRDNNSHRYAVVVAGGSGTRLWPLSRKNLPKQMQKFIGDKTLIDETVSRLSGVIPNENIYISTTENYSEAIHELLPDIPIENIITEPLARGTTAAFALFTRTIEKRDPEAILFTLASDHAVTDIELFRQTIRDSFEFVEKNSRYITLVGITPTQPDTGLGYIKTDRVIDKKNNIYSVEKFIEKPSLEVAKNYVQSSEYFWNAAYYCYKATTLIDAYNDADPNIMKSIDVFISKGDVDAFMSTPEKAHEIEFIDSTKYPLSLIPANFRWSDIGNWHALYELLSKMTGSSNVTGVDAKHVDINSTNCLVFSTEDRLISTIGLDNVAIISTPDALLVLNKDQPQEIKTLLKTIQNKGLNEYL